MGNILAQAIRLRPHGLPEVIPVEEAQHEHGLARKHYQVHRPHDGGVVEVAEHLVLGACGCEGQRVARASPLQGHFLVVTGAHGLLHEGHGAVAEVADDAEPLVLRRGSHGALWSSVKIFAFVVHSGLAAEGHHLARVLPSFASHLNDVAAVTAATVHLVRSTSTRGTGRESPQPQAAQAKLLLLLLALHACGAQQLAVGAGRTQQPRPLAARSWVRWQLHHEERITRLVKCHFRQVIERESDLLAFFSCQACPALP
mmetsp:Transcript_10090/g.29836  ORF Transcript_10090/g.29836 Transcript_10090/m.29836 type:complete len:257 (-) Transcript_10090:181-951(-)